MRFSYLIGLTTTSFDLVVAIPKDVCSTTSSFDAGDWLDAIVECVGSQSSSTHFTQASLEECVSNLVTPPTELGTHLGDTTHDATHACTTCVLTLANAIVDLFENDTVSTSCETYSSTDCQFALYNVVDDFNACADNGLDIKSGISYSRCTLSEFRDLQMNFDIYETIAPIAMINSVPSIDKEIVYESAGLTEAVAALSAPCALALDSFVDGLEAMTFLASPDCWISGVTPEAIPMDGDCLEDSVLGGLLTAFTGTHGFELRTVPSTHCTDAADISMINETLRPYHALTKCATETLLVDQEACVSALNGLFDSVDSNLNCYPCFLNYMNDVAADEAMVTDCLVDPSKSICPLVGNLLNGPLYKFAICAGFEMNTDATKCTTVEKNHMGTAFLSYTQLVTCGLFTTASERLACLANVHPLNDGFMEDSTSGCLSCYWALVEDVQVMNAANPNLGLVCRNPFQAECKAALTGTGKPLDRFHECSGVRLVADSGIACTTPEFEALMDLNVPFESIVSYAFMFTTITEAFYNFDTLLAAGMETGELEWADIPCVSCFYNLIQAGFDLSRADKEICYADIASTECSYVYGVALETFYACSGHTVRFNEASTTTTTTTTTTAEAITTEAPATTAKGAFMISALVSLVAVLLN